MFSIFEAYARAEDKLLRMADFLQVLGRMVFGHNGSIKLVISQCRKRD